MEKRHIEVRYCICDLCNQHKRCIEMNLTKIEEELSYKVKRLICEDCLEMIESGGM